MIIVAAISQIVTRMIMFATKKPAEARSIQPQTIAVHFNAATHQIYPFLVFYSHACMHCMHQFNYYTLGGKMGVPDRAAAAETPSTSTSVVPTTLVMNTVIPIATGLDTLRRF